MLHHRACQGLALGRAHSEQGHAEGPTFRTGTGPLFSDEAKRRSERCGDRAGLAAPATQTRDVITCGDCVEDVHATLGGIGVREDDRGDVERRGDEVEDVVASWWRWWEHHHGKPRWCG